MANDKKENKINEVFEVVDQYLVEKGTDSAEAIAAIIENQSKFVERMAEIHNVLDKMLQMHAYSAEQLETYGDLSRTLIMKLQMREIELTKEAFVKAGNGIRVIKDTIVLPALDEDGYVKQGEYFSGELIWAGVTKYGIEVVKLVPDPLVGISFQKIPMMFVDMETAIIGFDQDNGDPIFRFKNDRVGPAFPKGKIIDKIGKVKDIDTEIKFKTKHESKMKEIKKMISSMEDLKQYKTLGIVIEETFKEVRKTNSPAEKPEIVLMTNIKGIFYCPSETKGDEIFTGAVEYAEWVIFEDKKSKTKVEVKSVNSDSIVRGNAEELNELVFALQDMVYADRQVFLSRIEENNKK